MMKEKKNKRNIESETRQLCTRQQMEKKNAADSMNVKNIKCISSAKSLIEVTDTSIQFHRMSKIASTCAVMQSQWLRNH